MKLNNCIMGELGELKFSVKAIEEGFIVSKPMGLYRYDFIVDFNGKLSRVQIKTLASINPVSVPIGNYIKNEIDFIIAYLLQSDIWYIIPIETLTNKTVNFKNNEQYKENWNSLR